ARLASGNQVWDTRPGSGTLEFKSHSDAVVSLAFSSDGTRLATCCADNTVRDWDARDGTALLAFKGYVNYIPGAAFSPDRMRVASIRMNDRTVRLWDLRSKGPPLEFKHNDYLGNVVFSPDGRRIATSCIDKIARLWDAQTGASVAECKGGAVTFSP